MPRVKQDTIKKISEMGMAKALQHAHDNDDPEFREAVKRYYPNAKYGPKTRAAAQAQSAPATPPPVEKAVPYSKQTHEDGTKGVKAAVARRVEPVSKPKGGGLSNRSKQPANTGKAFKGFGEDFGRGLHKLTEERKKNGSRQSFVRGLGIVGRAIGIGNKPGPGNPERVAARKASQAKKRAAASRAR